VETQGDPPADLPERFAVVKTEKNALTFKLDQDEQSNELLQLFLQKGARIIRFEEILPTFNEIFIQRVAETGE
jgi:ABC-type uncharacterized transport system ATPase subunit